MQLDIFWVAFLTWWLNQVITVLSYGSELAADTLGASRLRHAVAASLAAEYEEHTEGRARPRQGGRRIDPEFLDSLTDEEARYYFR
jgi:hypothetical protein